MDIRLQPVQLQRAERKTHGLGEPRPHEPLALETGENVVAEVAAAKGAEDNVRHVDCADEPARPRFTNEETAVHRLAHATDIGSELLSR